MKKVLSYIFLTILAGILLFLLIMYLAQKKIPSNLVVGSGMIEGDEVEISPKVPGKIIKLLVREGDEVKKGDPIAYLEAKDIQARVDGARDRMEQLQQEVERAKEAYLFTKETVKRQIEEARANLEAARARVEGAQANFARVERDWSRYLNLYKRRVISKQKMDEVDTAYKVAKAQLEASRKGLEGARATLKVALARRKEIEIRKREIRVLGKRLDQSKASLREALSYLEDTKIYSPTNGAVVEKLVEEGEVVAAGSPLVVVTDLDALYLKIYIPEIEVGKVALAQPSRIYVDAYPERSFPASVCFVAQRAEFTPKEVQTYRERVQYTFAVKLCIEKNREHLLKPGLPGDGVIQIAPGPWWNPIKKKRE